MEYRELFDRLAAAAVAGDGDALADCFTDDGVYEDYFFGPLTGRQGMRDMLGHFHATADNFRWEFFDAVGDGQRAYARYRFSYDSKAPEAMGVRVAFDGMSCIELKDGRIARYREVFDRGMALVQQNFAPERIAKVLRKHAAALKADPAWAGHLPPPAAH